MIGTGTVMEDSAAILLARVRDQDGTLIEQTDIESVACTITDITLGIEVSTPTYTVYDVIYNELQTDSRWTADDIGYNFGAVVPASALPNGNKRVRVEFVITPVSGEPFHVLFALSIVDIVSS